MKACYNRRRFELHLHLREGFHLWGAFKIGKPPSPLGLSITHIFGWTRGPGVKPIPLPRGEGGPLPAFSPAGAGRVRGNFRAQAELSRPAKSAMPLYSPRAHPNPTLPGNAAQPKKPKKRQGTSCAAEGRRRSFAAPAAAKTGLLTSTALSVDWRSSLMAVFILSRAKSGETLRKRII